MKSKQQSLTKKDLLKIKKLFNEQLEELFNRFEALLAAKLDLNLWFEKLDKRLEKIEIKNDLVHETYLDLVLLMNLQQKKIKELEKRLKEHQELRNS